MSKISTLEGLRSLVRDVILEKKGKGTKAKSKKPKKDDEKKSPGFQSDERLDFSVPQGDYNVYRHQGAANWGPHTSTGPDVSRVPDELKESIREITSTLTESEWLYFVRPRSGGWKGILEQFVDEKKKG